MGLVATNSSYPPVVSYRSPIWRGITQVQRDFTAVLCKAKGEELDRVWANYYKCCDTPLYVCVAVAVEDTVRAQAVKFSAY
jgi:hypothetical protein